MVHGSENHDEEEIIFESTEWQETPQNVFVELSVYNWNKLRWRYKHKEKWFIQR